MASDAWYLAENSLCALCVLCAFVVNALLCRVFGITDTEPPLQSLAPESVQADDRGWFRAQVVVGRTMTNVERYLADEDGIRDELNTWAAWVEVAAGGAVQER